MRENRSFIFFRETQLAEDEGPLGAAGVPLTPGRSLAVDRTPMTFHTPVWVDAPELTDPAEPGRPFRRLMIAQDTGSAIVGPARGDLFFGSGDAAGALAGRVRHAATMFALVPAPPRIGMMRRLRAEERELWDRLRRSVQAAAPGARQGGAARRAGGRPTNATPRRRAERGTRRRPPAPPASRAREPPPLARLRGAAAATAGARADARWTRASTCTACARSAPSPRSSPFSAMPRRAARRIVLVITGKGRREGEEGGRAAPGGARLARPAGLARPRPRLRGGGPPPRRRRRALCAAQRRAGEAGDDDDASRP